MTTETKRPVDEPCPHRLYGLHHTPASIRGDWRCYWCLVPLTSASVSTTTGDHPNE